MAGNIFGVDSPKALASELERFDYLADEGLSVALFLALSLGRPILLEGEAGVGKTEVAKTLSEWLGVELIRLQCYEGVDSSMAVYEWDYPRQLLHLRTIEVIEAENRSDLDAYAVEGELYSERFLIRRPLLRAIDPANLVETKDGRRLPPVLLIDEIDRADDEFEAYLLEVLSDFSITVPELGTFVAEVPPIVIITSNRTRDVHDALKRRCLYHWVEHPDFDREVEIITRRAPQVERKLAGQVAALAEQLRGAGLYKPPGIAEVIDWAQSLAVLGEIEIGEASLRSSLGAVLKYREDQEKIRSLDLTELVRSAILRGA
ncbi:MAG: MoxR family ATPase [Acidimicrobiaceae bacterium]|nr:MoxR family ATPase [Acidimicrobiaceae bacterium]